MRVGRVGPGRLGAGPRVILVVDVDVLHPLSTRWRLRRAPGRPAQRRCPAAPRRARRRHRRCAPWSQDAAPAAGRCPGREGHSWQRRGPRRRGRATRSARTVRHGRVPATGSPDPPRGVAARRVAPRATRPPAVLSDAPVWLGGPPSPCAVAAAGRGCSAPSPGPSLPAPPPAAPSPRRRCRPARGAGCAGWGRRVSHGATPPRRGQSAHEQPLADRRALTTHRCSAAGSVNTRRWSPTATSSSSSRRCRPTSEADTSGSGRDSVKPSAVRATVMPRCATGARRPAAYSPSGSWASASASRASGPMGSGTGRARRRRARRRRTRAPRPGRCAGRRSTNCATASGRPSPGVLCRIGKTRLTTTASTTKPYRLREVQVRRDSAMTTRSGVSTSRTEVRSPVSSRCTARRCRCQPDTTSSTAGSGRDTPAAAAAAGAESG